MPVAWVSYGLEGMSASTYRVGSLIHLVTGSVLGSSGTSGQAGVGVLGDLLVGLL